MEVRSIISVSFHGRKKIYKSGQETTHLMNYFYTTVHRHTTSLLPSCRQTRTELQGLSSRHTQRGTLFSAHISRLDYYYGISRRLILFPFLALKKKKKERDNEHSVLRNKSPCTLCSGCKSLSSRALLHSQPGLCCRLSFQFSPNMMEKEKSLSKAVIVCFWGERTNY